MESESNAYLKGYICIICKMKGPSINRVIKRRGLRTNSWEAPVNIFLMAE